MGSSSSAASCSRAVAAAAGAVGLVVAHAHRDARHALVAALRALAGAKLRLGLVVVHVFNAVLDEERLRESFQLQLALAAVQLCKHGLEDGIFFGVGAGGLGGGCADSSGSGAQKNGEKSARHNDQQFVAIESLGFIAPPAVAGR